MASSSIPTIRLLLIALAFAVLNAIPAFDPTLIPADLLPYGNLILAMFLSMEVLWLARKPKNTAPKDEPSPVAPAPDRGEKARHELAHFLGLFQEKGRLVDFLMEDIRNQPDERVGQVARVVHEGCAKVLSAHFDLHPLREETEGGPVTLEDEFAPATIRLVGSVPSSGAIKGSLVHKGWTTKSVTLPELTRVPEDSPHGYVVAPAEIEVK